MVKVLFIVKPKSNFEPMSQQTTSMSQKEEKKLGDIGLTLKSHGPQLLEGLSSSIWFKCKSQSTTQFTADTDHMSKKLLVAPNLFVYLKNKLV